MSKEVMKTVVELAGDINPSLKKSIQTAQKALGGIDLKAAAMGAAFAAASVVAIKALAGISKSLLALEDEFGTAYDAIRVGTGATGEQLKKLENDCDEVFKAMPTDIKTAGDAIADYNTRLGLSGEELQILTKQAVALNKMFGTDVPAVTEASSLAFKQWGIANSEMAKSMDYVFKVSQSSGVEITKILGDVQRFGPAFKELGYSFEESAALIGKVTKAGYNADEVMTAMKKSIGVMAAEGVNAGEGFRYYYMHIKNAASETKAIEYAMEIFGAKGGASMAAAIRSGALELEDFTNELDKSQETIMGAYKTTWGYAEYAAVVQNRVQESFKPLTQMYERFLTSLMPHVIAVLDEVLPIIERLPDAIRITVKVIDELLLLVAGITAGFAAYKTAVMITAAAEKGLTAAMITQNVVTAVWNGLMTAGTAIGTAFGAVMAFITSPIGAVVIAIGAVVAISLYLWKHWDDIVKFCKETLAPILVETWGKIKSCFGGVIEWIVEKWKKLTDILLAPFRALKGALDSFKALGTAGKNSADASLPMLATGGFTDGVSIAGENGQEAVISFDSAYRSRNIDIWQEAGEMLGVGNDESTSVTFGDIIFAPQVSTALNESISPEVLISKIMERKSEFIDFVQNELGTRTRSAYGGSY